VLGAVREGEQADMPGLPARECLEGGLDQALSDAPSPEARMDRERPEEPDTAPVDRKVGPDQLAVHLGGKARGRIGQVAGPYRTGVAAEAQGIRKPEEGAEGEATDPVGSRQVRRAQRSDQHVGFGPSPVCSRVHRRPTRHQLEPIPMVPILLYGPIILRRQAK
jgi:hypothetical protein